MLQIAYDGLIYGDVRKGVKSQGAFYNLRKIAIMIHLYPCTWVVIILLNFDNRLAYIFYILRSLVDFVLPLLWACSHS